MHSSDGSSEGIPSAVSPRRDKRFLPFAWWMGLSISTAFPIVASLVQPNPVPRWVGITDVSLAAFLMSLAVRLHYVTNNGITDQDRLAAYSRDRFILHMPLVLLAVFFLFGDHVDWTVLLCGLAWRAWLLSAIAPHLAAYQR